MIEAEACSRHQKEKLWLKSEGPPRSALTTPSYDLNPASFDLWQHRSWGVDEPDKMLFFRLYEGHNVAAVMGTWNGKPIVIEQQEKDKTLTCTLSNHCFVFMSNF